MKRLYSIVAAVIITAVLSGQAPASFKYQAVLRDALGNVRSNVNVSIDIAILQESATGTQVFFENHIVTTNEFGLVNLEIGSKNPIGFSDLDWSAGPYFIKIIIDNVEMGTSQLLSVPYALYAETTGNGFSGDYNDLDNKPDFTGWDENESDDFSGEYNDLTNKPVLFSGNYTDLTNKPVIPPISDATTSTTSLWSSTKTNIELGNKANVIDVYTKANLQTSGQALVHYNNLNNKPTNIDEDKTDDVTLIGNQTILGNKSFSSVIIASNGMNSNNKNITNVAIPINAGDAANKEYVDAIKETIYNELLDAGMNGIVKDVEGNTYKTIKIGDQIWMAENLKTTKFNDGTPIPNLGGTLEEWYSTFGYGNYNNDTNNVAIYGRIYQGIHPKLCPTGWHASTYEDWMTLETYLGGRYVAGGKLKEADTIHWKSPNVGADNSSGFTALPGGYLFVGQNPETGDMEVRYQGLGTSTVFGTTIPPDEPPYDFPGRFLSYNTREVYGFGMTDNGSGFVGYCIRCVKD